MCVCVSEGLEKVMMHSVDEDKINMSGLKSLAKCTLSIMHAFLMHDSGVSLPTSSFSAQ